MKVLAFALLFAAANASFLDFESAAKPIVELAVHDFVQFLQSHPFKLHEALNVKRDVAIDEFERQVQTELGQALQGQLNQVMGQIQDAISHGQTVAQSLVDKAKELTNQLKELGGNIVTVGQSFLNNLLTQGHGMLQGLLGGLGIGKRSGNWISVGGTGYGKRSGNWISVGGTGYGRRDILGDLLNGVVNTVVQQLNPANLLQTLLGGLLGGLGKRDALGDLLNGVVGTLVNALNPQNLLQNLLGGLLGGLGKRSMWNALTDTIGQIISHLSDKFADFKDWVTTVTGQGINVVQGHITNIKQLATEFVSHAKELSAQTVQEAIDYFRPYKEDLGTLWNQIQAAGQTIQGQAVDAGSNIVQQIGNQ